MQGIIVVSNRPSRRTEYFQKAARELGVEVRFMTYEELDSRWPYVENAVVKLEPCVDTESDYLRYAQVNAAYRLLLRTLGERPLPEGTRFLNSPAALLLAADKLESKRCLQRAGLRATPLVGTPSSFDELRSQLATCRRGCFLKPRYGSGAGGVMAIRYRADSRSWTVYTALQAVDGRVYNTKRIHRLTQEIDIALLAEAVIQTEALLEEWIPKSEWDGLSYDLRAVCRQNKVDYLVPRCSRGVITNLHLNNHAREWADVPLGFDVRQAVVNQSVQAGQTLGLHYAGIDLLVEKDTDTPYIIEVNGQGDHIYQDMFARNLIYTNQLKELSNHAD